jgi:putative transposase
MPRANRYYLPGQIWHLTHRCHKKEFLLKFAKDRNRWRRWLFEAKKRYGLCVLNYIITSNHVHILVLDKGRGEIAKSMQLIAGRTAQEYNVRKKRKGAFWEDRYHATAVDTDQYLARCMAYIDLNMVRAGVVNSAEDWRWSGYHEIQSPLRRYSVIDFSELMTQFGVTNLEVFQEMHRQWALDAVCNDEYQRQPLWTKSLAVGGECYIEKLKLELESSGQKKSILKEGGIYMLQEEFGHYS